MKLRAFAKASGAAAAATLVASTAAAGTNSIKTPMSPSRASNRVSRRHVVKVLLAGSAAAIAAPAVAQSAPTVTWRMASSFPKNLDTLFQGGTTMARVVSEMTDGKFKIQTFAAGEIVPGLQVLDAVQNGTVECGHTYSGYFIGKDPSLIFDGSLPFGLTPRQHQAWLQFGGGRALVDEVYDRFNVKSIPAGNTNAQPLGWFRKEIKSVDDLKGLKMRIAGFGGLILRKLGGVPQQIAGGDIYAALEKGTIDAAEFVGFYDDEKIGLYKVAPYCYGPFVMEMEAALTLLVGKQAWASLPPAYQAILKAACAQAEQEMIASYDAKNAQAIARVIAKGAKLSWMSQDVIKAMKAASEAVLDEEAARNEGFKKILTNWRAFRAEQHRYHSIADARAEMVTYSHIRN
jgi:TRAP-type mannitol/chloroaromatic compound transport system substrate-binding protein